MKDCLGNRIHPTSVRVWRNGHWYELSGHVAARHIGGPKSEGFFCSACKTLIKAEEPGPIQSLITTEEVVS